MKKKIMQLKKHIKYLTFRKFNNVFGIALAMTITLLFSGCQEPKVQSYNLKVSNLFPEGISYDATTAKVFVSSMKYGKIGMFSSKEKNPSYQNFVDDPILISTSGITVDSIRRRLFVANVDVGASVKTNPKTQKKIAGVAVYDLDSGKRLAYLKLHKLYSGEHFVNEIEIDSNGNAYVSDSFSPVIYKINSNLKNASVFIEDPIFGVGDSFKLNGLALSKKLGNSPGYLLATKYNSGELYRIDLLKKSVELIKKPDSLNLIGADGLEMVPAKFGQNSAILVVNQIVDKKAKDKIVYIEFDDDFLNVKNYRVWDNSSTAINLNFPTTLTVSGSEVFVLNGSLGELFQGKSRENFEVLKFNLKDLSL